jgi:hypothetical protein
MRVIIPVYDSRDIEYITENFIRLDSPRYGEGDPGPSYVIDGVWYVPTDYFEQERDPVQFRDRFVAEARALGLDDAERSAEEAWDEFLTGIYGVCLRRVTPENIARKQALISRIEALTAHPHPEDAEWKLQLRNAVDALDELERPFSPVYDRVRFGRPPTRDTHINDVVAKWLNV